MLSNKAKAVGFILMSAFGFAMMNVCVRLSGNLPTLQKAFFRNLIAMLSAAAILLRSRVGFHWEKGNLPLLVLRSVCGTMGIFCNFYAIDHLLLADANILNKMSPFFAILFSLVLLHEKANLFQYLMLALAFIGSMLVIKPGFSAEMFPAFVGLFGGMSAGAAYTAVRALSKRNEKSARIVFFFSAFSMLASLPSLLLDYNPMTLGQFVCLIGAGLFAAVGQFGVTFAYSYAPAKEISVFDYTQVLFSALLGFWLFGQMPDILSMLGYVVICGVSVVTFYYNRILESREQASGNV